MELEKIKLRFIGTDGSMGLKRGRIYLASVYTTCGYIWVAWGENNPNKVYPYSSLKTLCENWESVQERRIRMATISVNNNYRDKLVQQIKEAGQELIDRAEDMVSEGTELITDFSININIPQGKEYMPIPEISWTTEVVSKNTLDRLTENSNRE